MLLLKKKLEPMDIQKALSISSGVSEIEKDYINALATRYTNNPQADFVPLRFKYRDAMKKLMEKYPEDLDVATLYAEYIEFRSMEILDMGWQAYTRSTRSY